MLRQDVRYALRSLWHSKGFATVAILCLGLGIGLNTTIFGIADGVLLQPYPYTDPDRILVIGEQNRNTNSRSGLSHLDMRDWKEANSAFTTIAASQGRALTVSDGGEEPERDLGAAISWDLFPMLGTPALAKDYPATNDGWSARVRTLREAFLLVEWRCHRSSLSDGQSGRHRRLAHRDRDCARSATIWRQSKRERGARVRVRALDMDWRPHRAPPWPRTACRWRKASSIRSARLTRCRSAPSPLSLWSRRL